MLFLVRFGLAEQIGGGISFNPCLGYNLAIMRLKEWLGSRRADYKMIDKILADPEVCGQMDSIVEINAERSRFIGKILIELGLDKVVRKMERSKSLKDESYQLSGILVRAFPGEDESLKLITDRVLIVLDDDRYFKTRPIAFWYSQGQKYIPEEVVVRGFENEVDLMGYQFNKLYLVRGENGSRFIIRRRAWLPTLSRNESRSRNEKDELWVWLPDDGITGGLVSMAGLELVKNIALHRAIDEYILGSFRLGDLRPDGTFRD